MFTHVTIAGNNDFQFRLQHQTAQDNYLDVLFFNSIFWDNDDDEDNGGFVFHGQEHDDFDSPRLYVENSLLSFTEADIIMNDHETNQITWSSNNLTSYPYFNNSENDDYSLSTYSPMIGAGGDSPSIGSFTYEASDTDILGNARPNPSGTSPDIGAYESSESTPTYNPNKYVSTSGSNSSSGAITDPFLTIQHAVDQSQDNDIINVAAGTYVENIDYDGKNLSIIGANRETTIIDGDNSGVVVRISDLTGASMLKNFTIQNGYTVQSNTVQSGGGVSISNASPMLQNLIVKNSTAFYGGGIFMSSSSSKLDNVQVFDNVADDHGGGIYTDNSNPLLINVACYNNTAGSHAGGVFFNNVYQNTSPTIIGGSFHDNQAIYGVGGVFTLNCAPSFYQSNIVMSHTS